MIGKILSGIFKLIIGLVSIILSPIDALITSNLPGINDAISSFNILINYVINFIGYCIDATGLSSTAINLIIIYYGFILVVPLSVYTIKLAIRWYNALKP